MYGIWIEVSSRAMMYQGGKHIKPRLHGSDMHIKSRQLWQHTKLRLQRVLLWQRQDISIKEKQEEAIEV